MGIPEKTNLGIFRNYKIRIGGIKWNIF